MSGAYVNKWVRFFEFVKIKIDLQFKKKKETLSKICTTLFLLLFWSFTIWPK